MSRVDRKLEITAFKNQQIPNRPFVKITWGENYAQKMEGNDDCVDARVGFSQHDLFSYGYQKGKNTAK